MNRHGPDSDRLERVPLRPHRLAVAVLLLSLLGIIAFAYRHTGARWPGNASGNGRVDVSETDAARRSIPAQPRPPACQPRGARSAGGFHHP